MAKTNEWKLLKQQFDATTRHESVEGIEDIFDAQFRRRFADLINHIVQSDSTERHIAIGGHASNPDRVQKV